MLAAPAGRVERERPGRDLRTPGLGRGGEPDLPDVVVGLEVGGGSSARRAADRAWLIISTSSSFSEAVDAFAAAGLVAPARPRLQQPVLVQQPARRAWTFRSPIRRSRTRSARADLDAGRSRDCSPSRADHQRAAVDALGGALLLPDARSGSAAAPGRRLDSRQPRPCPRRARCRRAARLPGPRSITWSEPSMMVGSCSTSTTVLPIFVRWRSTFSSRRPSRGCRPTVGSSSAVERVGQGAAERGREVDALGLATRQRSSLSSRVR